MRLVDVDCWREELDVCFCAIEVVMPINLKTLAEMSITDEACLR